MMSLSVIPMAGFRIWMILRKIFHQKVSYKKIKQLEISELKQFKSTISIRRTIKVEGLYKNQDFEMKLAYLKFGLKRNLIGNCGADKVWK